MASSLSLEPGTLIAGKFRIERLLGAGAMGEVYAIRHELTRHRRALKLLHADVRWMPDLVGRFLNEASAAGRAGSPHLVETFDAGTLPSGEPYVVMELLEGSTLSALLDRTRMLDPALAAEIVAQAAEGMEAAHRAGIIHRDLKPDNLFVTYEGERPFVKILDFGVSKFLTESAAQPSRTRAGALYGSPAYMSPEQISGRLDVDARSDVFGLGIVLYQCLSGRLPFEAPTLEALSTRILASEPTPLSALRPELSPALVAVVHQALELEREDRFVSARALADALAPHREGNPRRPSFESAGPPPANARAASAQRWRVSVGASVLGLGLTVTLVARWGDWKASPSRPESQPRVSSAALPQRAAPGSVSSVSTRVTPVDAALPTRLAGVEPARSRASNMQRSPERRDVPDPLRSVPAPAAAASARVSPVESLGLESSNPFR